MKPLGSAVRKALGGRKVVVSGFEGMTIRIKSHEIERKKSIILNSFYRLCFRRRYVPFELVEILRRALVPGVTF